MYRLYDQEFTPIQGIITMKNKELKVLREEAI